MRCVYQWPNNEWDNVLSFCWMSPGSKIMLNASIVLLCIKWKIWKNKISIDYTILFNKDVMPPASMQVLTPFSGTSEAIFILLTFSSSSSSWVTFALFYVIHTLLRSLFTLADPRKRQASPPLVLSTRSVYPFIEGVLSRSHYLFQEYLIFRDNVHKNLVMLYPILSFVQAYFGCFCYFSLRSHYDTAYHAWC